MSPIWGAVVCSFIAGTTARAVDSITKPIYIRDDTPSNTHDYDLSLRLINQAFPPINEGGETLTLTCLNCSTFGTAQVSSFGINKNQSFFDDIANLIKIEQEDGLSEAVASAIDLNIMLDFQNTGALINLDLNFDATASHTFNLLTLPVVGLASPIDGAKDNVGIVLLLDLILNVNAAADFVAGFEVSLGDSATIMLDPIGGKILSFDFSGLKFDALPAKISDPNLEFSASLRATLEVGTRVSVDLVFSDEDVSFEAGVFVDLVKYSGNVTSDGNITLSAGSMNSTVAVPPYATGNGTSWAGNITSSAGNMTSWTSNTTSLAGNGTSSVGNTTASWISTVSSNSTTSSSPSSSWNSAVSSNSTTSSGSSSSWNSTASWPSSWKGTVSSGNGTSSTGNSSSCGALFQEELSIDIGAFAEATANITLGPGFDFNKAITTTLASLPLPTICL